MKKLISMLMLLTLALGCAEGEDMDVMKTWAVPENEAIPLDLDGDGSEETLTWRQGLYGMDGDCAELFVTTAGGETLHWQSGMLTPHGVWAGDLDGDGRTEILVTGDEMSDDYVTWALRLEEGELKTLTFANGSRGDEESQWLDCGYGLVTGIEGNRLTLEGSQDVLGTYFASRDYALQEDRFVFCDDGLYRFEDGDDEALWEYRSLTLRRDLPVTLLQDGEGISDVLQAGTQLRLTASDKVSIAYFRTRDGREGCFPIAPDEEQGWGFVVEGVPEEELFEALPYAD